MSRKGGLRYAGRVGKADNFCVSVKHAIHGLVVAVALEANLRRQLFLFTVAVVLGLWLNISAGAWLMLFGASGLVLMCELFNSALEALADAVHPMYDDRVRQAKDMAAAGVLVASIVAFVVGALILGVPLAEQFPLLWPW